MRNLVILSGTSHPTLVESICQNLAIDEKHVELKKFSNGETSVTVQDSVREKDVYVVQSGCGNVNDNFIELLIMISACKTASARKVTAVMPLFPYSRQPDVPFAKKGAPLPGNRSTTSDFSFDSGPNTPKGKQPSQSSSSATAIAPPPSLSLASNLVKKQFDSWNKGDNEGNSGYRQWVAQAGTLIASLLTCAGADHIITMDLHDPQFQGYFDIPVDNLYGKPLLQSYITSNIPGYQDAVIVSPDAGGAKRATSIADSLGMPFALIHKERKTRKNNNHNIEYSNNNNTNTNNNEHNKRSTTIMVGDVSGKVAILIDDLVDTANTITRAAKLIKDQGAIKVYAIITHGLFSGDAVERIKASAIDKIVTTNSTPQEEHAEALGDKLDILDVSRVFGEAIRRIHNGESVSMLFDHVGF